MRRSTPLQRLDKVFWLTLKVFGKNNQSLLVSQIGRLRDPAFEKGNGAAVPSSTEDVRREVVRSTCNLRNDHLALNREGVTNWRKAEEDVDRIVSKRPSDACRLSASFLSRCSVDPENSSGRSGVSVALWSKLAAGDLFLQVSCLDLVKPDEQRRAALLQPRDTSTN